MTVVEYGREHNQVILLLHGGGLSWWNYREAAKLLEDQYRVVLPVLDGHADSDTPFTTIEENAVRILSHIDTRYNGQVLAIGGLSLGGQIVVEMLSQRKDCCRYALIESALVKPARLTAALVEPAFDMSYSLIKQKWFSMLQAGYLEIPEKLFNDYYRDTCRIRKEDMIAFLKANSIYSVKPGLSETSAKVKIVAGSREQKNIRNSAKTLHEAIPGSSLEILPGMRHGNLSIRHPEAYAKIISDWIGRQYYDSE